MKRKKWIKVLSLLFSVMLLCVGVVGCTKDNGEEKYDVQIKLKNNLGEEIIFDLETSKIYVEYEYTGEEIKFWVDSYNMPDHPRYGEDWLGTNSSYGFSCRFHKLQHVSEEQPKHIIEKGEYVYNIHPIIRPNSIVWRERNCQLFVTIV